MESPPFHLGRKNMKYRLAMLIGGIILSTAVPVWGDSISCTGITIESPNTENSANEIHNSHTKLIATANTGFLSEAALPTALGWSAAVQSSAVRGDAPSAIFLSKASGGYSLGPSEPQSDGLSYDPTPAMVSIGNAFGGGGSERSSVTGSLGFSSSDRNAQSHGQSEFDSSVIDSSDFTTAGARHGFGHGHGRHDGDKGQGSSGGSNDNPPVTVPEPGALSFLLLGAAAIGMLAKRRSELPATA
jgi:PEP-CTERM motif